MARIDPSGSLKAKAWLVHFYTATGAVWAILAAFAIVKGDFTEACLWLMLAMAVDSTDGSLARRFQVTKAVPNLDGRKLDDIVDYLNYTFLPILLIAETGALPDPVLFWVALPLLASLFAFCSTGAKEEKAGFFLGFPSYWNVIAVYVVLWLSDSNHLITGSVVLGFSLLTILPLRFVYPNHAPRWKSLFVAGAIAWLVLVCFMLIQHPGVPCWMIWVSLSYPALYLLLSFYLDFSSR